MDKETEDLGDKYLRDAGYDPDVVRGRKSRADIQHEADLKRREQWRIRNSFKAPGDRQVGLTAPTLKAEPVRRGLSGFLFGFFIGRWL